MNNDIVLSEEQQTVFDKIVHDLTNGITCALNSPAGTGKTTLTSFIADELKHLGKTFHLTTTTHKAAGVLSAKTVYGVKTIHSLLGLELKVCFKTGDETFVVGKKEKQYQHGDIIIVDESSMINKELFKIIVQCVKADKLTMLFVFDEKQLEPVNEPYSMVSQIKRMYTLTKVMRNDNSILNCATMLRDMMESGQRYITPDTFAQFADITVLHSNTDFHALIDETAANGADFRVLGWTNNCIEARAARIRNKLGYDALHVEIGEEINLHQPVFDPSNPINILAQNGSEHIISRCRDKRFHGVDCIEVTTDQGIKFITKIDFNDIKNKLAELAEIAKADKSWKHYFTVKNMFCKMGFTVSTTVHKSQGSEFETVFIDYEDINKIRNTLSFLRMLYVAITRSKNKVVILMKRG